MIEGFSMPTSIEAEKAILGSILLHNKESELAFEKLNVESFYSQMHRDIFSSMAEMKKSGIKIDLITLRDFLRGVNVDSEYIASLVDGLPKEIMLTSYVNIVRDKEVLRNIIKLSENTIDTCSNDQDNPKDVLFSLEGKIFKLEQGLVEGGFERIGPAVNRAVKRAEKIAKGEYSEGVSTGFIDLNKLIGNFRPGNLVVLAGRPSVGKSTLALCVAVNNALEGKNVGIISLEDSIDNISIRILCNVAKVNSEKISRGYNVSKEDWAKIAQASATLRETPIYIDDHPASVFQIGSKARTLKHKHGLDLLIVDYLQLVQGADKYESRTLEVEAFTQYLKNLAKELEIPVICISQLNRMVENRPDHRPRLADLRESGAIEQISDLVIFLWDRSQGREEDGMSELAKELSALVAKNRNGCTGSVDLLFLKAESRFDNLEKNAGLPRDGLL